MTNKIKKVLKFSEIDTFAKKTAQYILDNKKNRSNFFISLNGDLGTGKTTFVKQFAKQVGIIELVRSPTFNLIQEYFSGEIPMFHFDVYRLNGSSEELYEIGYEEYLNREGIVVIEWADLIKSELPSEYIDIRIYHFDEEHRMVEMDYIGNDKVKEEIIKYVYTWD